MKPKHILILNGEDARADVMIIANITTTGTPRFDELEGRKHIIVPVAMLAEGVHVGNNGPGYYPPEEITASVPDWNGKPIIVYHSTKNGQGVSAQDPEVFTKQKVGVLFNVSFDSKLRAEAWLDVERLKEVDNRILEAIENGEIVEVSTGLGTKIDQSPGTWNNETYEWVARDFKPDHLAILPDKTGAYSVADGGGLLQLNENPLTENITSFSDITAAIRQSLEEVYAGEIYVEDVFQTFVIFERFQDGTSKLFKVPYTRSGTDITIPNGSEVEVRRVSKYEAVSDGTIIGNSSRTLLIREKIDMDKKKFVDGLIANERLSFTEDDREALMSLNEETLKKLESTPAAADPEEDAVGDGNGNTQNQTPATPSTEPKAMSLKEMLANASPEDREAFEEMRASHSQEKDRLVSVITANENSDFSEDELKGMRLNDLRRLAKIAAVQNREEDDHSVDFSGNAPSSSVQNSKHTPLGIQDMWKDV